MYVSTFSFLRLEKKNCQILWPKRMKPFTEKYLSPFISPYWPGRGSINILWTSHWIVAKIQIVRKAIYHRCVTFDTINRRKLWDILKTLLKEDELLIIRPLKNNATLETKSSNDKASQLSITNIWSFQEDGLSGKMFGVEFTNASKEV